MAEPWVTAAPLLSPPPGRYNNYLHDPLSLCQSCQPKPNAENAISARSDLNPANGSYPFQALQQRSHGGIDAKVCSPCSLGVCGGEGFLPRAQLASRSQVTNVSLVRALGLLAVSGPTWDQLPPFQWSTSPFSGLLHMGQPDLWKFLPVEVWWQ